MTVFNEVMGRPPVVARKRVLVTGVNGFMGSYMADLLLGDRLMGSVDLVLTDVGDRPNAHVERAMDSGERHRPDERVRSAYVPVDLRSVPETKHLVNDEGPFTHVLHIAGLCDHAASYEDLESANVRATVNLVDALAVSGRPPGSIVVWGDGRVYDLSGAPEKGLNEDAPIAPATDHLRTKYEGEMRAIEICRRYGMPVTVLRPGRVYGPRAEYGVGTAIMFAARGGTGPFFFGDKKHRVGTVHAEDVCRAGLFLAARPRRGAYRCYNVSDDSSYTMYELSRAVAERLGFPMLPVSLPLSVMERFIAYIGRRAAKRGRTPVVDGDAAKLRAYDTLLDASALKALGWSPVRPDALEGIMETIDWYEKEGRL